MRGNKPLRKSELATQLLSELPLPDGITTWTASTLDDLRRGAQNDQLEDGCFAHDLFRTIDILGARSQQAQGVNAAITSVSRLHENATYKLFLLTCEKRGLGILKIGVKKLFLSHPKTKALVECDPLCILDFYVSEELQRRGFGKQLFEHALDSEGVLRPETLAIDSPSPKFLSFLRKYYGLEAFTPQVNNFVVFHRFFDHTTVSERGRLRRTDGPAFNGDSATVAPGKHADLKGNLSVLPRQSSQQIAHTGGRHSLGPLNPLPTTTTTTSAVAGASVAYSTAPASNPRVRCAPVTVSTPSSVGGNPSAATTRVYKVDIVQPHLNSAPYLTFRDDVNSPHRRSGVLAPLPRSGGDAQMDGEGECPQPPPKPLPYEEGEHPPSQPQRRLPQMSTGATS